MKRSFLLSAFVALPLLGACGQQIRMSSVEPKVDDRDYSVCAKPGIAGEGRMRMGGDLRVVVNNRLRAGCAILEVQRIGSSLLQRSAMLVPGKTQGVGFRSYDGIDPKRAGVGAAIGGLIGAVVAGGNAGNRAKGALVFGGAGAMLAQEISSDPRANISISVYDANGTMLAGELLSEDIPSWRKRTLTIWITEDQGRIRISRDGYGMRRFGF